MSDTKVGDFYGLLGMRIAHETFEQANHALEKVKHAVEAFLAFEIVKGLTETVEHVFEVGDEAVKTGKKLGITAEAVQELGYASGLAGVDQDALTSALGKLAKNLDEVAHTGAGPAADALHRLGIKAKDLKGESLDQNLEVIAEKFKAMPDGIAKTSLAMALFGKTGKNLIPLLDEGKEGIVELREEAHQLGVVIDNESAGSMEKMHDDVERLGAGWKGIKTQIILAVLPLVKDMLPSLVESMKEVVAWVKEHKDGIKEFFQTLGRAIKIIVQGIVIAIGWISKAFKVVGTAIGQAIAWIVLRAQDIGHAFSKVWDMMSSGVGAVRDVIVGIATAIKDAFLDAFAFIEAKWADLKKLAFDIANNSFVRAINNAQGLGAINDQMDQAAKAGYAPKGGDLILENRRRAKKGLEPLETEGPNAGKPVSEAHPPTGPTTPPPSVPPTSGQPQASNVDVGGIHIQVHAAPGMDEQALATKVGEVAAEMMTNAFRHAKASQGTA